MQLACCILILLFIFVCEAYKVLIVFPVPGRSHAMLGEGFVRNLLDDGHEITYITPFVMKTTHPKLRQIDISSNFKLMPTDHLFDTTNVLNKILDFTDPRVMVYLTVDFANGTINHPAVQRLIQDPAEHFDAVIVEWLYSELYSGFSSVFNCPLIWSSSMEPHWLVTELIDESFNPAYNPQHLSDALPPFNFFERVQQLWSIINTKYLKWRLRHKENRIFNNAFGPAVANRGRTLPSFYEAKYNGSLMFGNSHVSSGIANRLPPNYIPIGGYHINENTDPLPENLQKITDEAKEGFIYFSLGSMLKSSRIPSEMKTGLLEIFSRLNQTVIWKFEELLPDAPKNVHITPWAPQQSILAHPNCKLFITHGGLLSILESLHFAVPIIGMPFFGDQPLNINRIVQKGFGKRVDLNKEVARNMEAAIKEIIEDPRYAEKAKEYSYIYHDRLISPQKEVKQWVRHVIRTQGAPHLRSPGFLVPWYQKMYLDLAVVIIVALYLTINFTIMLLTRIIVLGRNFRRYKQKLL
ncbi:UDP-glucosyltransferase 2-like [Battus philenor]|uniref:UDP-glucosyltransferase 2-like n=1 Tax=Battus philenor TaxID=42288 RepID=UPI0035D133B1